MAACVRSLKHSTNTATWEPKSVEVLWEPWKVLRNQHVLVKFKFEEKVVRNQHVLVKFKFEENLKKTSGASVSPSCDSSTSHIRLPLFHTTNNIGLHSP